MIGGGGRGEEDLVEALVGHVLVHQQLVVGAAGAVADEVDHVPVLHPGEQRGLVPELPGALP